VALVALLVSVDVSGRTSRLEAVTAEDLLENEHTRITFYAPREELPAVKPANEARKREGAKRARERFRQKIVADDPSPQSLRQKIIGVSPEIEIEQDIPSPNLLAWNAPKVSRLRYEMVQSAEAVPKRKALRAAAAPEIQSAMRAIPDLPTPAGPRLRFQRERKAESSPARQALAPQAAPELRAATAKVDLATLSRPTRLRYWTPEVGPQVAPERQAIQTAKAPSIVVGQQAVDLGTIQGKRRLRYWTAETKSVAPGGEKITGGKAPSIQAKQTGVPQWGSIQQQPRIRYRSWGDTPAAPKQGALTSGEAAPKIKGSDGIGGSGSGDGVAALLGRESLADVAKAGYARGGPASQGGSQGGPLEGPGGDGPNALIVGLDPDPNAVEAIPVGSRRGRFSASPDGGPGGGDLMIASAGNASLRAPNLSIEGGEIAGARAVMQRKPQEKRGSPGNGILSSPLRDNGVAALSLFERRKNIREIGRPPVIDPDIDVRSKNPEILFLNREVFVMAVNTPNVTSYSGSWVVRFAERRLGMRRRDGTIESDVADDPSRGRLSAPGPKLKVDPKYVRTAADEGVEGTVTLYALIRMDGSVSNIELVKSVDERLDASAMEALAQWQFHPATRLGVPVEVDVLIDIPFRLAPPEERARRVVQRF
jgi:TonB family protein